MQASAGPGQREFFGLPNPPPVFIGRRDEMAALAAAIRRAPVAIVVGLGGIGKTALALATLRRRWASQRANAMLLSSRESSRGSLLAQLLEKLGATRGKRDIDRREAGAQPEALAAQVMALAEQAGSWLVLDDLERAPPAEVEALLRAAARYADRSRWIALSRLDPGLPELAGQVIRLGGLSQQDLGDLARRLAPAHPEQRIAEAVHWAAGSPERLRRAVLAQREVPGAARAADDLLADLDPDSVRFVAHLAVCAQPRLSAQLPGGSTLLPAQLERLERLSLVDWVGDGYRVHEAARSVLEVSTPPEEWAERQRAAASMLVEQGDAGAVLEGLRLHLERGASSSAALALATRADVLVKAGLSSNVWRLLEPCREPELERWRLRFAAQAGGAALDGLSAPPADSEVADHLAWARVLEQRGDYRGAAEAARTAGEQARREGRASLVGEAAVIHCRCLLQAGRYDEAVDAADELGDHDSAGRLRLDATAAMALWHAGRWEEGAERLRDVHQRLTRLRAEERRPLTQIIARSLYELGRLREAADLLPEAQATATPPPAVEMGRRWLKCQTALAIDLGNLNTGDRLLARLLPLASPGSPESVELALLDMYRQLSSGELERLGERIALLHGSLSGGEAARARAWLRTLAARLDAIASTTTDLRLGTNDDTCGFPSTDIPMRLCEYERALRRGENLPPPPAPEALPPIPWVQIAAHRQRALMALRTGELELARRSAERAAQVAKEFGYGVLEAEALQLLADVAWVEGDRPAVANAARSLLSLAQSMPSARFAGDARFASWLAARGGSSVGELAELARQRQVSPIAARRAQALLGLGEQCDWVDALVLARARAAGGWVASVPAVGDAVGADAWWLLDDAERCIWGSDGRRIDLSRREVPWRLLRALVEGGGEASKEDLVLRVWDKSSYHPLHDDNRLKLGIKSLRRMVETDPQQPAAILTTSEGYSFAARMRVALLTPPPSYSAQEHKRSTVVGVAAALRQE